MMNDPKLFRLTEQDKLRYLKLIEKINPMHKNHIVLVLGEKIQNLLNEKNLNTIEIELINQMSHFVQILESYKNLPD